MEVLARKITYEEFTKMEFPNDDPFLYELLNGELVRKNAPSGEHQFTQSKLFYKVARFVDEKDTGMVFSSPTAVILSEENAPQPDLIFLSKGKMGLLDPEWGIRGAPDMVVEIVSPSSYKRDHLDKKKLYAEFGVTEYWIVDPSNHSIEVYVLKEKAYQLHAFGISGEQVTSKVLEGFSMEVDAIFIKKPEVEV